MTNQSLEKCLCRHKGLSKRDYQLMWTCQDLTHLSMKRIIVKGEASHGMEQLIVKLQAKRSCSSFLYTLYNFNKSYMMIAEKGFKRG